MKDVELDALQVAGQPAQKRDSRSSTAASCIRGRTPLSELPELVGILIAFLILLVTFGAFVAAGLPIISAIIGVVISDHEHHRASPSFINIASASTTVAIMLGLSCGIDYGLFILSRHRNNLLSGMAPEDSVAPGRRHGRQLGRVRRPDRHHRPVRAVASSASRS